MLCYFRLTLCIVLQICVQLYVVDGLDHSCQNLSDTSLVCKNYIPDDLSDEIDAVKLFDINPKLVHIGEDSFTGKGWSQIRQLQLMTLDAPPGWITLTNNTFHSLLSLRYLQLLMPALRIVEEQTFAGLNNLTELDLTGCKRTSLFYILRILQNENSLPNLSVLKLVGLNKMGKSPAIVSAFGLEFFRALATRNITEFYARSMFISTFDVDALTLLCDSLEVLDLSHSSFIHFIATATPCTSLRRLNLNSINTQNKWGNLNFENIYGRIELYNKFYFFRNVVKLKYDNFFKNVTIIKNVKMIIHSVEEFNLKEISMQHNLLRYIDADITADLLFNKSEKLEIQHNTLEYLKGGFFRSFTSLKMLNMSYNRLSVMQKYNSSDFENMLYHLKSVQIIDLSNNGLTYLPRKTFRNNPNLEQLYLSNNRIEQISLISSVSLALVSLQDNAITHFDQTSRRWFDEKFGSNKTFSNFVAIIDRNPFQCVCKHLAFLQWIVHTPLVGNSSYFITCSDHKRGKISVQMTEQLNEQCGWKLKVRNIAVVSSIITVTVAVATLSTVIVYKRRRKKLRRKRTREEIIAQIQDNNYHLQYPVFMSYSNEDVDLVLEHVYPNLADCLRQMFDTPRDLVCIGDRHFRPGRTIFEEIDFCFNNSAVVICVVSRQFCQSNFCKYELEQAYTMRKQILLFFTEEIDEMYMPPVVKQHFNKYTRINLRLHDGQIMVTPSWEKICESILDLLST